MNQNNNSEMLEGLKLSEVAIRAALDIVKIDQHEVGILAFEKVLAEIRRIISKAESES